MTSTRRTVILTPFREPAVVAGVAKLRGFHGSVMATPMGAVVIIDTVVPVFDDWDIAELLGGDTAADQAADTADSDTADEADQPSALAAALSQLSEYGVVVFTSDLGDDVDDEGGVAGIVNAVRYVGGVRTEDIPAGVFLNFTDSVVEDIVIGEKKLSELGTVIDTDTLDLSALVPEGKPGHARTHDGTESEAPDLDPRDDAPADDESEGDAQ